MAFSPLARLERLLAPPGDPARVAFLGQVPFAHRGLHGQRRVENSRAAIDAAIDAGHGIEIDVRLTRDGKAMVFHDATLDRMTEASGAVVDRPAAELSAIRLRGSDETLPRLPEIVARIGGRVPLLIEIKAPERHVAALSLAVRRALEGYRGDVGVMSFDVAAIAWFKANAPKIVRGLVLSSRRRRSRLPALTRLAALQRAGPMFVAVDVEDLPSRAVARLRGNGLPALAWTIRDADAEERAGICTDQLIYEREEAPGE